MKVLAFIVSMVFLLSGCSEIRPKKNLPGVPLVYFGFDNQLYNEGILDVFLWGNDNRLFAAGIKGNAIDFGPGNQSQRPLLITFPDQYNPADYEGFTLLMWLKRLPNIADSCVVASDCHFLELGKFRGWRLMALPSGKYRWEMSDGLTVWHYQWHEKDTGPLKGWYHWGFQYHKAAKEAKFFLNGQNHAIVGLDRMDSLYFSGVLELGGSLQARNFSQRLFRGAIDGLGYWGRPLANKEVEAIFESEGQKSVPQPKHNGSFKIVSLSAAGLEATPSLWEGAAKSLSDIKAHVILLQNGNGFGHFLAEKNNGNIYLRGDGFCIVSKFPLGTSYRSVRDRQAAVVEIVPSPHRPIVVTSCCLSPFPLCDNLFREKGVDVYAFLSEEQKKRGTELRLFLGALSLTAKSVPPVPVVMGIDLNSGSHLDWTDKNQLAHNGLSVAFGLSKMLEDDGFVDSYRQYYPEETLFQGFNAKRGNASVYNHRQAFVYYKGTSLKLLESKVLSVMPEGLPQATLAVVSEFGWVD